MGNAFGVGRSVLSEEVPMGYKRTEVGMIPEKWSIQQLETICDVRDGTHESPRFYSSGVPLITSKNIVHGGLDLKNISCISEQDADRINKRSKVDLNDILMSMIGTIGSTVLIDFEPDFCIKNVALIKPQKVLPTFLIHLMASPLFQTYLKDSLDGGIQKFIALGTLRHLNIPLPPPTEQRAIAEALSDVDGLLAALEALIAKKRVIKQAAMQQLLTGKTRLSGFSGEWAELNMAHDSILKARIGWQGLTTAEYLTNGDYYLVTGTDFVRGRVDWARCFFVDHSRFRQDTNIQLAPYDVLLTKDGTIGKAGFIESLPRPATLNSGIFVIRPKKGAYVPKYMYYVLTSQIFDDFLARLQAGSTISHLYQKDFVDFTFKAPLINEQQAIVAVLSDMDSEIVSLERRRDKTRAVKQGMMQQLLTGRIRLVQSETITEELAVARPVDSKHNWQFNEAVVISVLAKHFGNAQYPLGRMRYTKFSYLLHRREDSYAEGYLKKAAGPYNPQTRYGGPEKIALQKDYMRRHRSDRGQGFIASANVEEAEHYFDRWYGSEVLQWLAQFSFKTNDYLELLTTVDMAAEELCGVEEEISVGSVKEVIRSDPEWKPKLDRPIFSDANLARAIEDCQKLFDY